MHRTNDNETKMSFKLKDFKLPHTLTMLDVRTLTAGYDVKKEIPGLYI